MGAREEVHRIIRKLRIGQIHFRHPEAGIDEKSGDGARGVLQGDFGILGGSPEHHVSTRDSENSNLRGYEGTGVPSALMAFRRKRDAAGVRHPFVARLLDVYEMGVARGLSPPGKNVRDVQHSARQGTAEGAHGPGSDYRRVTRGERQSNSLQLVIDNSGGEERLDRQCADEQTVAAPRGSGRGRSEKNIVDGSGDRKLELLGGTASRAMDANLAFDFGASGFQASPQIFFPEPFLRDSHLQFIRNRGMNLVAVDAHSDGRQG